MDLELANKRVLITAGASGIGRIVAESFASNGANVLVCDIDDKAVQRVQSEAALNAVTADVSNSAAVAKLFSQVEIFLGGLDILVNNAGVSGPAKPVQELTDVEWRDTFAVNLDSSFFCAREAIPLLKKDGGGSIINISSICGLLPYRLRSPYCAAKHGVIGFTRVLAQELGPDNVNVNAICPGSVQSPRLDRVASMTALAMGVSVEEIHQAALNQTSMRRLVTMQEISSIVLYLCSPLGRIITGQSIAVDGQTNSTE
ncbi:SDR family oxidoreductase (plasmid) [Mesorhizobium sp. AR07]|uniref:SDR family oxidoreductase n=1 Tax=Mesorhizobium sp. AR07 TaxID=2865838 RepID=UPI002160C9BD|nr:SDR family oxidoreductase [Mesorhizobium sp. AR07]UVK49009.1 SDR family oxidoreductase [Mesorhizobium sp. AR07]